MAHMDEASNQIPRRCRLNLLTTEEYAIRNAIVLVERLGADPRLTDAVVLLQQARDKVADYVDGKDCPTWHPKTT